jgi:hypothetical protein
MDFSNDFAMLIRILRMSQVVQGHMRRGPSMLHHRLGGGLSGHHLHHPKMYRAHYKGFGFVDVQPAPGSDLLLL